MAKTVMLNFADPKSTGNDVDQEANTLVHRSATAIKTKPKYHRSKLASVFLSNAELQVVDLYEELENLREGRPLDGAVMAAAKVKCDSASKIMVCIHGVHTDTDHGYATVTTHNNGFGIGRFVKYDVMGDFVGRLLPQNKLCSLALIMCYGGRSAADLNHDGPLAANDLKKSFAYKFFKILCADRPLRMTARTGFTGFNPQNGHSEVSTEASIDAEEEWRGIQDAQETKDLKRDSQAAQGRMQTKIGQDNPTMKYGQTIEARVKSVAEIVKGTRPAVTADEKVIKQYGELEARNTLLATQKGEVKSKYGKLLYRFEKDVLKINRKYPDMELLYSGPLL